MRSLGEEPLLEFRHMTSGDRGAASEPFRELLLEDEFFRDSAEAYAGPAAGAGAIEARLGAALSLFVERPDYGFVWMAFENERAVGAVAVAYAISIPLGAVAATVEHAIVASGQRRRGIATMMFEVLIGELRRLEIARVDVNVHAANYAGREFYLSLGFLPTNEARLSLLI